MIVFRCPSLLLLPILETSIDNLFLQFLSCLRSRDLCPRRFYVIKTQADHTELLRAALGGLKFSFRSCRLRRPLGPAEPRSPWLLMACILAQATDFSFRAVHSPEKAVLASISIRCSLRHACSFSFTKCMRSPLWAAGASHFLFSAVRTPTEEPGGWFYFSFRLFNLKKAVTGPWQSFSHSGPLLMSPPLPPQGLV